MLEEVCRRQGGEPTSSEIARGLLGSRNLSEINARIAALSRGLTSSDVQREVMLLEEQAAAAGLGSEHRYSADLAAIGDPLRGPFWEAQTRAGLGAPDWEAVAAHRYPQTLTECVALVTLENDLMNEKFFNRRARTWEPGYAYIRP